MSVKRRDLVQYLRRFQAMIAKSHRFWAAFRVGPTCLLSLLLAARTVPARAEVDSKMNESSTKLAKQLAQEMDQVQRKFDARRAALPTVPGPGGAPAYPRQAVIDLIDSTEKELDQAIERMKEPRLAGLRAWGDEQIEESRHKIENPQPLLPRSGRHCPTSFR